MIDTSTLLSKDFASRVACLSPVTQGSTKDGSPGDLEGQEDGWGANFLHLQMLNWRAADVPKIVNTFNSPGSFEMIHFHGLQNYEVFITMKFSGISRFAFLWLADACRYFQGLKLRNRFLQQLCFSFWSWGPSWAPPIPTTPTNCRPSTSCIRKHQLRS